MIFDCETYLSDDVRRLLINQNSPKSEEFFPECLNPDLTFNWTKIDTYLNVTDDFQKKVDLLWPLMNYLHEKTCGIKLESVYFPEMFKFYDWLVEKQDLLVVLKMTSQFERFLGDVFHLKNKKVPFLLKDLLESQELKEIFGNVQIELLRILFGNVKGVNIRNIAWHGFISYGEIQPSLISTLLLLINSTSLDLKKYLKNEAFIRREKIVLNHSLDVPKFDFLPSQVPTSQKFYWDSVNLNLDSLTLILPLFEHILRLIFCQNHNLECIKANTNEYYVIMDDMLAYEYNGEKNCLIGILGSCLEMILDLFYYPSGPRLRDRIGHDELQTVPQSLIDFTFYTISCCLDKIFRNKNTIYKSKFHIFPILINKFKEILNKLNNWDDFPGVKIEKNNIHEVLCFLDAIEIETLYMPRNEIHCLQQLKLISNKIEEINQNVEENCRVRYKDYVEKKMRSRGRENYLKMIQVLPILKSCVFLLVLILSQAVDDLSNFDVKYFKKCLKFVENLSVMCRLGENKWSNVEEMCHEFLAENEKFDNFLKNKVC